jgi:hypothetical protein
MRYMDHGRMKRICEGLKVVWVQEWKQSSSLSKMGRALDLEKGAR